MKQLMMVLALFAACPSFAASQENRILELVSQHYLNAAAGSFDGPSDLPESCRPDSTACVQVACGYVSCSARDDLMGIVNACAGNNGGGCLTVACGFAGSCATRFDLIQTIQAYLLMLYIHIAIIPGMKTRILKKRLNGF